MQLDSRSGYQVILSSTMADLVTWSFYPPGWQTLLPGTRITDLVRLVIPSLTIADLACLVILSSGMADLVTRYRDAIG